MHDIRLIRDEPAAFDAALARRGLEPQSAHLIALDERRRSIATELQTAQGRRNEASKAIGHAKAAKDEAAAAVLMAEVGELKTRLPALEEDQRMADAALDEALAALPNLPAADVPDGADESGNLLVHLRGELPAMAFDPREHFDIGAPLGLDFESAAAISGARFVAMRGPVARLHRALGQYMLDIQTGEHGYTEVAPPLLVRDEAVFGTGQLPKFADDLFRTTDGRWLIPTAEVSLTNLVREQILSEEALPLRFAALTPCFRSEAGAAGRDTRGLIRQHQFDKVEMVSITTPEASAEEHERMTACAETILERLGLPYRRMLLARATWASAQSALMIWKSGCRASSAIAKFRVARPAAISRHAALAARYRPADPEAKGTRFVHTLNGSGLAVGRTLVAVLEKLSASRWFGSRFRSRYDPIWAAARSSDTLITRHPELVSGSIKPQALRLRNSGC